MTTEPRERACAAVADELGRYFRADPFPGVLAAYLFGSAAEGRMHRESDVDVGVLLDRTVYPSADDRAEARVRLGSDLIHVTGNNAVDLVVLNDAPPELGRRIVRGLALHVADAEADHAFRRDVQLRAADLAPFLERVRRIKLERLRR